VSWHGGGERLTFLGGAPRPQRSDAETRTSLVFFSVWTATLYRGISSEGAAKGGVTKTAPNIPPRTICYLPKGPIAKNSAGIS
jgi:hypothetical protein